MNPFIWKFKKWQKGSLVGTLLIFLIFYSLAFPPDYERSGVYPATEFGPNPLERYFSPFSWLIYNVSTEYIDATKPSAESKRTFGFTTASRYESDNENPSEVVIVDVIENSPAGRAGLLVEDKIISVNGTDVVELESGELGKILKGTESAYLSLVRGGTQIQVEIEKGPLQSYSEGTNFPESPQTVYVPKDSLDSVRKVWEEQGKHPVEYNISLSPRAILLATLVWTLLNLAFVIFADSLLRRVRKREGILNVILRFSATALGVPLVLALLTVTAFFFSLFRTLALMGDSFSGGFIDLSFLVFPLGWLFLVVINFVAMSLYFRR